MDKFFFINVCLILVLFVLHILEINIFAESLFPFFDENFFYEAYNTLNYEEIFANLFDKYYLFFLIGKLSLIFSDPIVLKFANVFVLIIFIVGMYQISDFDNKVFKFFPVFLPYMYFLSYLNMRDMLIITAVLFLILEIQKFNNRRIVNIVFLSLIIWMLRPLYFIIFIGVVSSAFLIKSSNNKNKIIILIVSLVAFFIFKDFVVNQFEYFKYVVFVANYEKNLEMLNYGGEITPFSYFVAFLKMLTTPLPTSKISQLFSLDNMSQNLYLIEISRIIMHGAFYYLMLFTIVRLKTFYFWIRNNRFNLILFLFAFANTLAYSFYRMGSGSSRNKLWPIILLFLFFVYAKRYNIKSKIRLGSYRLF